MKSAWEEIRCTRRETWDVESRRLQRKLEHLSRRSEECRRHRTCRELEEWWGDRCKRLRETQRRMETGILGKSQSLETIDNVVVVEQGGEESGGVKGETVNDPASFVKEKYTARPEDLEDLNGEEERLKKLLLGMNRAWRKDPSGEVDQEDIMT